MHVRMSTILTFSHISFFCAGLSFSLFCSSFMVITPVNTDLLSL